MSKSFHGPCGTDCGYVRPEREGEAAARPCLRAWLISFTLAIAFIFSVAIVHAKAGTVEAAAHEIPDVRAGERLAHNLCINCHVVDTRSTAGRADRIPAFSWIAKQPGKTATSITV